jgi:hypothetical protein
MNYAATSLEHIGRYAAHCLCSDMSWIKRRKHRVSFIDDAVVRHHQSVDFIVPGDAPAYDRGDGINVAMLPLFVLRKAPRLLLDFDFRDEEGKACSLPTRAENAAISAAALCAHAQQVLNTQLNGAQLQCDIADELVAIAEGDSSETLTRADALLERDPADAESQRSILAENTDFRFLVGLLAWASIVAVPVRTTQQHLLKLSYSEPIYELTQSRNRRINLGWDPLPGLVVDPFVGAGTFHLEVHPPKGMNACRGQLAAAGRDEPDLDTNDGASRVLHLYLRNAENKRTGFATFDLVMQRDGYVNGAAWSALAVAMALLACVLFADQLAANNTSAPAYLLLFPGLIATYVTRPGEHPLTWRLLGWSRLILAATAICAYLAAGWLVVAPTHAVSPPARSATGSTPPASAPVTGRQTPLKTKVKRAHQRPRAARNTSTPRWPRDAPSVSTRGVGQPVRVELVQRQPTRLRAVWVPLMLVAFCASYMLNVTRRASSTA